MEIFHIKKGLSNEKMKKALKKINFLIKFKEKTLKKDLFEKIKLFLHKDFNGLVFLEINLDYLSKSKMDCENIKKLKIKQLCLKVMISGNK